MHAFLKIAFVAAAGASALAASVLPLSVTGPLPGHTGGFGEPTCRLCHYDYDLNEPGAGMRLDSLPEVYEPSRRYSLTLRLQHAELKRAGFQLSARFEDGTPAGTIVIPDTTLLRIQRLRGVDYLSHNFKGTEQIVADTAVWNFVWVAPASMRRVVFNAAFNVSDDDASQFGDRIFTAAFYSGAESVRK